MTSFAIYEFVGLILALPLSYWFAWFAKKHTYSTYKDELEKLFQLYWNGEEDDEMNAWLKVKNLIPQSDKSDKRIKFINKQIKELNKSKIYSNSLVDENGDVNQNPNQVKKTDLSKVQ